MAAMNFMIEDRSVTIGPPTVPGRARMPRAGLAGSASDEVRWDRVPASANDLDCTLIAAVAEGDQTAFNQIHARYYSRIARFTGRITRRSELVAEITNDTLWAVWRCARSFKGNSKVSTWIMGIAYHIGSKTLGRSSRREGREEPIGDFGESSSEPCSDGDEREWLGAALMKLSEEQRNVLELFYQLGYSCHEIGEIVDCPTNTVKTRLYHGRRNLRQLLSEFARSSSMDTLKVGLRRSADCRYRDGALSWR